MSAISIRNGKTSTYRKVEINDSFRFDLGLPASFPIRYLRISVLIMRPCVSPLDQHRDNLFESVCHSPLHLSFRDGGLVKAWYRRYASRLAAREYRNHVSQSCHVHKASQSRTIMQLLGISRDVSFRGDPMLKVLEPMFLLDGGDLGLRMVGRAEQMPLFFGWPLYACNVDIRWLELRSRFFVGRELLPVRR